MSEERLQELVYGQWLHADLQVTVEPGQACVPPAVLQNQSYHISGTFIVQVNSHVLYTCAVHECIIVCIYMGYDL